jgi:hypothetical protein
MVCKSTLAFPVLIYDYQGNQAVQELTKYKDTIDMVETVEVFVIIMYLIQYFFLISNLSKIQEVTKTTYQFQAS